jgi:DNA polymerase I-like protein with 3'-5' exonuclease and polymerase domains
MPLEDGGWRPPRVSELPDWRHAKRVAIDVETKDEDLPDLGPGVWRPGCCVVGFAVAIDYGDGKRPTCVYVPVNHFGGGNVSEPEAAWAWLRDNAREFRGVLVNAHLAYDMLWLAKYGVVFPLVTRHEDPLVLAPLLNELHDRYDLDSCLRRAGFKGKSMDPLYAAAKQYHIRRTQVRSNLWMMDARHVWEYGIGDVEPLFAYLDQHQAQIDSESLRDVWDLECGVLPITGEMRERGVGVDFDHLERVEERIRRQLDEHLAVVHEHTGVRLSPGDPDLGDKGDLDKKAVLAEAFEAAGIELPETPTGQLCTNKKALAAHKDHPVVAAIVAARAANTQRKMFVSQVRRMAVGDRIHFSVNQVKRDRGDGRRTMGTVARFSIVNPSLQNMPRRGEDGASFRETYVPERGKRWVKIDYKAQELRLIVHYACLLGLRGAIEAAQRYHDDPEFNLFRQTAEDAGLDYDPVKNANYARCYGAGNGRACETAGLPIVWKQHPRSGDWYKAPTPEGWAFLNSVDEAVPFLMELRARAEERAKELGYITTIHGRRQRFPENPPGHEDGPYALTYKGLSRLIQGSAADQIKLAMIELTREGVPIQLQVHDEVDLSASEDERPMVERAARIMEDVLPLRVPVVADVSWGDNWGRAK